MQEVEAPTRVRFGVFEADLKAGELRRAGIRIRIQRQPFKVLALLLEHAGELVTREQIQQRLWGNDTTVDFDHSLGIAINKLRETLSDSADNPRFIETLARRGYRFIAPVMPDLPAASVAVAPALAPVAPSETVPVSSRRGHWRVWLRRNTLCRDCDGILDSRRTATGPPAPGPHGANGCVTTKVPVETSSPDTTLWKLVGPR